MRVVLAVIRFLPYTGKIIMPNTTIRVGIAGAGGNTKAEHISGLQALENVVITGVCNRSRASSQAVASQFDIPRVFDDREFLVTGPDIDAVVIGTWPYIAPSVYPGFPDCML